jgi:ketosteroid isomerase-like protein
MEELVTQFFEALSKLDSKKAASCYAENIELHDPIFGVLKGERAAARWHMLCEKAPDLKIDYRIVQLDDVESTAWVHWDAHYTNLLSNKPISNKIDTHFTIKDGKFIVQEDDFQFKNWIEQSFGTKGKLIGGVKVYQKKLSQKANKMLDEFLLSKG